MTSFFKRLSVAMLFVCLIASFTAPLAAPLAAQSSFVTPAAGVLDAKQVSKWPESLGLRFHPRTGEAYRKLIDGETESWFPTGFTFVRGYVDLGETVKPEPTGIVAYATEESRAKVMDFLRRYVVPGFRVEPLDVDLGPLHVVDTAGDPLPQRAIVVTDWDGRRSDVLNSGLAAITIMAYPRLFAASVLRDQILRSFAASE